MFHYMNEKEVTFNVKYEIVLYTPVFNARWGGTVHWIQDNFVFGQNSNSLLLFRNGHIRSFGATFDE